MKTYALLDKNNVVINISVADDSWDSTGWIQYTNDNPAIIGGTFIDGYFYDSQPYPSWKANKGTWIPPTPRPLGFNWSWNQEDQSWDSNDESA